MTYTTVNKTHCQLNDRTIHRMFTIKLCSFLLFSSGYDIQMLQNDTQVMLFMRKCVNASVNTLLDEMTIPLSGPSLYGLSLRENTCILRGRNGVKTAIQGRNQQETNKVNKKQQEQINITKQTRHKRLKNKLKKKQIIMCKFDNGF